MKKDNLTRRDFLKLAAAFAAANALGACKPSAPTQEAGQEAGQETGQEAVAPEMEVAEVAPGVPRNECLILENPTGTVLPADDFNRCRYTTGHPRPVAGSRWSRYWNQIASG